MLRPLSRTGCTQVASWGGVGSETNVPCVWGRAGQRWAWPGGGGLALFWGAWHRDPPD